MDEEVRGRWIGLCLTLGVISNSGLSHLNGICLNLPHSFTQYKNSISWHTCISCISECYSSTAWDSLFVAGKERVNSFVSRNTIQVIVSVSYERLLITHEGNNVVRSNCWAKGNCEIFRSEKKKQNRLPLLTGIHRCDRLVYPWKLPCQRRNS